MIGNCSSSEAAAINDAGQVVGYSAVGNGASQSETAALWSGGKIINLGALFPEGAGSFAAGSFANAINDSGQVVGWSSIGGKQYATEWSPSASSLTWGASGQGVRFIRA